MPPAQPTPAATHKASPSPSPVLYTFRRCPYAMRARLAIGVSGVPVRLREVLLRDKPAALLAASAKGTVPVLVCPDGHVIDQSLDIMRWALQQHDPQTWLLPGEGETAQVWIDRNDGPFKQALDAYKYAEGGPTGAEAQAQRARALTVLLQPMEAQLAQRAHLMAPQASLADMALLPFVRQFAAVDAAWFAQAPLPQLRAWLQRLTSSPLFTSIGTKLPVWQPGAVEPWA